MNPFKALVWFLAFGINGLQAQKQTNNNIIRPQGHVPVELITTASAVLDSLFKVNKIVTIWTFDKNILNTRIQFFTRNVPVKFALDRISEIIRFPYSQINEVVVFRKKEQPVLIVRTGIVVNDDGKPIEGASIIPITANEGAISNEHGIFSIPLKDLGRMFKISSIGYNKRIMRINDVPEIKILLQIKRHEYDSALVSWAYGPQKQIYSTETVFKVRGTEIPATSSNDPASYLQVPGVYTIRSSGFPNSISYVNSRGPISVGPLQGASNIPIGYPNVFINTIQHPSGFQPVGVQSAAAGDPRLGPGGGGPSGLNIHPKDIECLEFLSGAGATAIYGARAGTGALLLTTKKAGIQKTLKLTVDISKGLIDIPYPPEYLNTAQLVNLRESSIRKAGKEVNSITAPDLEQWGRTNYTDFSNYFLGKHAPTLRTYLSAAKGDSTFRYFTSISYTKSELPLPVTFATSNFTHYLQLIWRPSIKLKLSFTSLNGLSLSALPVQNPMELLSFIPTAPALVENGKYIDSAAGIKFKNPLAQFENRNETSTHTMMQIFQSNYCISERISFKVNAGFSLQNVRQNSYLPMKAHHPDDTSGAVRFWAKSQLIGWQLEPQLNYTDTFKEKTEIRVTTGITFQSQKENVQEIFYDGIEDHNILSGKGATTIEKAGSDYFSGFNSLFSRVSLIYNKTFVLDLSGRFDKGKHDSINNKWKAFGSIGSAILFSELPLLSKIKENQVLSFGKLYANMGYMANDGLQHYHKLREWALSQKENLEWEKQFSVESGIQLNFFKKITVTGLWYLNKTGNQLINHKENGIQKAINHPAKVQNTGIILAAGINITFNNFIWNSNISVTFPRNKLTSFPELPDFLYKNSVEIGEPLTVIKGFIFKGLNPDTRIYEMTDLNNDKKIDAKDITILGHTFPVVFGYWANTISVNAIQLRFSISGRKQKGMNPLGKILGSNPGASTAGMYNNFPTIILQEGLQAFTTSPTMAERNATNQYRNSSAMLVDKSFLQLETVQLSWTGPFSPFRISSLRVYLEGLNMLRITPFKGGDPTLADPMAIPTTRQVSLGIEMNI